MINVDEDALELLYWEFLDRKNKKNYSERDCFKTYVRGFVRKEIRKVLKHGLKGKV